MQHWTIRRTEEREVLIESLRDLLGKSGRDVERVHGVVTTSAIIDEALKMLLRDLEAANNTEGHKS
jgi:hypothetical protein